MEQTDGMPPEDVATAFVKASKPRQPAVTKPARAGAAHVPAPPSAGSGFEAQLEAAVEAVQAAVHENAQASAGVQDAAVGAGADVLHQVEAVAAASAEQAIASASAEVQQAPERAAQGMETIMKTAEDMIAFGQGNIEALLKSSQIWATGVQDLSKQMAATAQANLDETMTSFKAFSGVKSLKDAMDLQAQFARVAMEKTLAETGRLTDASLKLAEQALAPITARVTLAVETMVKPA